MTWEGRRCGLWNSCPPPDPMMVQGIVEGTLKSEDKDLGVVPDDPALHPVYEIKNEFPNITTRQGMGFDTPAGVNHDHARRGRRCG